MFGSFYQWRHLFIVSFWGLRYVDGVLSTPHAKVRDILVPLNYLFGVALIIIMSQQCNVEYILQVI